LLFLLKNFISKHNLMNLKDFIFSYKNILFRSLFVKKNFFDFIRKLFNIFYKYLLHNFRTYFSNKIINLDKKQKKNQNLYNEKLDDLFVNFNTDKGTSVKWDGKKINTHGYSAHYEKYLQKFKSKTINILEIGSHEGRAIASFYYYFPNSNLYGANNNPFQIKFCSKRIKSIFVDVSSRNILSNLAKHYDFDFDLIIDDASHNLRDILITISVFFRKLKKKGVYVIEDISQLDYVPELNKYNDKLTPKKILEMINNKQDFNSQFITEEDKNYLIQNIERSFFEKGSFLVDGVNTSEIAFIKKF